MLNIRRDTKINVSYAQNNWKFVNLASAVLRGVVRGVSFGGGYKRQALEWGYWLQAVQAFVEINENAISGLKEWHIWEYWRWIPSCGWCILFLMLVLGRWLSFVRPTGPFFFPIVSLPTTSPIQLHSFSLSPSYTEFIRFTFNHIVLY